MINEGTSSWDNENEWKLNVSIGRRGKTIYSCFKKKNFWFKNILIKCQIDRKCHNRITELCVWTSKFETCARWNFEAETNFFVKNHFHFNRSSIRQCQYTFNMKFFIMTKSLIYCYQCIAFLCLHHILKHWHWSSLKWNTYLTYLFILIKIHVYIIFMIEHHTIGGHKILLGT